MAARPNSLLHLVRTDTLLFLSIVSIIALPVALAILHVGGNGMLVLLWSLIRWRRSILLSIRG